MKNFTASNFEGECIIDSDFEPYLIQMNQVAAECNIIVVVLSSFRKNRKVKGAIVTPAKKSNHMVAWAIDCNLRNSITGEYYNSKKMADGVGQDEIFCDQVVLRTGLRWGFAFKVKDSVHFDYPLNLRNPELWQKKYLAIQSGI